MPLSNTFKAHYYDGQGVQREAVSVTLTQAGLSIERANGLLHYWRLSEVRQANERVSGGKVRIEHGQTAKEALVFADRSVLQAIVRLSPYAKLGKRRAKAPVVLGKTLAGLAVASAAAAAALYLYLVPTAGAIIVRRMPPRVEIQLGNAIVNQLAPRDEQCFDYGVAGPVASVLEHLLRHIEGGNYQYKVHVSSRGYVNAFALPGGSILVYRGLLEKTGTPEEFAAALAHDIAHVLQKHATQAAMRSLTVSTLIPFASGDINHALVNLAGHLDEMRYSREDEEAASEAAMRIMERARLNPRAMAAVSKALRDAPAGSTSYHSTHPSIPDRLHFVEEWAARARYVPAPILAGQPWPPQPRDATACAPPR